MKNLDHITKNFLAYLKEGEEPTSTWALVLNKQDHKHEWSLFDTYALDEYIKVKFMEDPTPSYDEQELINEKVIVGYIYCHTDTKMGKETEGMAEVILSVVNPELRGQGIGKEFYKIVASAYPKGLVPSRAHVSNSAQNMYKSLKGQEDIETFPSKEDGYRGVFDDINNPQTKPEDDDFTMYPKTKNDPDGEVSQILNVAYKYTGGEQYKALVDRCERYFQEYIQKAEVRQVKRQGQRNYMNTVSAVALKSKIMKAGRAMFEVLDESKKKRFNYRASKPAPAPKPPPLGPNFPYEKGPHLSMSGIKRDVKNSKRPYFQTLEEGETIDQD